MSHYEKFEITYLWLTLHVKEVSSTMIHEIFNSFGSTNTDVLQY